MSFNITFVFIQVIVIVLNSNYGLAMKSSPCIFSTAKSTELSVAPNGTIHVNLEKEGVAR